MSALERGLPLALALFCGVTGGEFMTSYPDPERPQDAETDTTNFQVGIPFSHYLPTKGYRTRPNPQGMLLLELEL